MGREGKGRVGGKEREVGCGGGRSLRTTGEVNYRLCGERKP